MRILLLESHPGVGAVTEAELVAHGHDVVHCHEAGQPAFPCRELESPGSCPLRGADAVEVAVVVHDPAADSPTMAESGVACALRNEVPVVSRHDGTPGPFAGWTFPVGSQPVSDACEVAVLLSRATEAHPLVTEVRRLLAAA